MANEQVLVMSASPEFITFVADQVLQPKRCQVFTAPDTETGLKMAVEQQPDLILLEMENPKLDGEVLLDGLKHQNIHIPVIMIGGPNFEMTARAALQAGVKDYLSKPVEAAELLLALDRNLSEVRLRREQIELKQRLQKSEQALQQRGRELDTLFGIGKSVTSLLGQKKLLTRLVEAAIYLTNADESALMLVDEETNELYMAAARGMDERVARSFRVRIQDSLAGQVLTSGQPLILSGQEATQIKTAYLVRSLIYLPLKIRDRVRGVLSVHNRQQAEDFSNHDLRLLSALADYAAIYLENIRLGTLIESEHTKLATVLSEIVEPVVVIAGQENNVVAANTAFRELFDLTEGTVQNQPLATLIFNPALEALTVDTVETVQPHKSEIPLADGRTFYATLTPVPKVGRAIIMQDITHLKALDQMKSEFVATVSHDLRAPLGSIKEYAQMLTMVGELDDKQALFVNRINKGVEQVLALIDNLLDLSTIEAGIDPNINVVDLGQLTAGVMADFQNRASRKGQRLIVHLANEPVNVMGNELRLRQVISNLLNNAIKYSPASGQISVIVQRDEAQVIFKVEDDGDGIPPADLPFVFDKFFRSQEITAQTEGTGLGLAICKSIIEMYGGQIWAKNKPDRGVVFTFTLPLVHNHTPVDNSSPVPEIFST